MLLYLRVKIVLFMREKLLFFQNKLFFNALRMLKNVGANTVQTTRLMRATIR